jgi:multidrug efflux pump subunit AcrA (membrane-fusion protein)
VSHTEAIVPRIPLIAGALGAALLLAGCGGSAAPRAAGSVRLAIAAPRDMASVRDGSVQLSGTVHPAGATVTVRGRRASIAGGGSWTASVPLEPGVNVVDVLASSGSSRPALTALRVRRIVDIDVPDVSGLSADDAKQQIEDAHLVAKTQTDDGGFFDQILGGDPQVCSTDPEAGTTVDPGSTVTIHLSRRC